MSKCIALIRFVVLALAFSISIGSVTDAQILTNPSEFSGNETIIDFEGLSGGTPVSTQYAPQGVTFELDNVEFPLIFNDGTSRMFGPIGNKAITNFQNGFSLPLPNLIISFDDPTNRVAFEIRTNTADNLNLTLKCMIEGDELGTEVFVTNLSYSFVGLESSVPFDQVILDVT